MNIIIFKNIPCPIMKFEGPDSYLIIYKNKQKWIYKSSFGYGEIFKDDRNNVFYWINEVCHRDYDMPARINDDGTNYWYFYGKLHRDYKPAVIDKNNSKFWFQFNEYHRLDGPAVEYNDTKTNYYYINDKIYEKEDYWEKVKELKQNGII